MSFIVVYYSRRVAKFPGSNRPISKFKFIRESQQNIKVKYISIQSISKFIVTHFYLMTPCNMCWRQYLLQHFKLTLNYYLTTIFSQRERLFPFQMLIHCWNIFE